MLRKSKKSLAILLTFAMLATLFVGVPMASAATTYGVLAVPTIVPPANNATFGTITMNFDTLNIGTHSSVISLPNTDYNVGTILPSTAKADQAAGGTITLTPVTAGFNTNEFRFDIVVAGKVATDVLITLTIGSGGTATVPSDANDEIHAKITALSGQMVGGDLVVAKASTGQVTAYIDDLTSFNEAGTTGNAIKINFKENAQNAIKKQNSTLKVTLPSGYTWNAGASLTRINDGTNCLVVGPLVATAWTVSGTGKELVINRPAADTLAKGIFRLEADVSVDSSTAVLGDVEIDLGGDSSYTPSTLKIGTYVDYGIDVVAATELKEVKGGRIGQKIGKFEIKEKAADSLLSGRTVTMRLPAGLKWATIPVPTISGGGLAVGAINRVGSDAREVKFTVINAPGGGKGTITFENATVDAAADFSGDVVITFAGGAGAEGEIIVGTTKAAITAKADAPDLKIGVQNQAAGSITLVEGYKEAFKQDDLVLTAPTGVKWSQIPTVTVKEGNVEVDVKGISGKNTENLTIPIKSSSSRISTIEISDIKFTVDRTVPEGSIEIKIGGPSVNEVNDTNATATLTRTFYPTSWAAGDEMFPQNDDAATAINGKCVTPAPGEQKANVSFTIGETKYLANGVEQTMDVAPYIKNDRTYMPIRYVAMSLGVAEQNIMWDDAAKAATLIKGDKVVQVKIGSNVMLINGISINMDVAPEITNDRTMLPLRFIGQAFGADFTWDDATKTATMNL